MKHLQLIQAAFILSGVINQIMARMNENDPFSYLNEKAQGMPPATPLESPFDKSDYSKRDEYLSVVSAEHGTVVAGLHRVSYKGFYDKSMADCFDFKQFSKVVERSITRESYNSTVDYSVPDCNLSFKSGDDILFFSEVYGFTKSDCSRFASNYSERALRCVLKIKPLLFFILGVAALITMAVVTNHYCRSRSRTEMLRRRLTLSLTARSTVDSVGLLRGINRSNQYTEELQNFIKEVNSIFEKLTNDQIAQLETALPDIYCGISLCLPSQPVKLGETLYDLDSLLAVEENNGLRRIPHMADIGFTLDEIKPATEEWTIIKNKIYELFPNIQPNERVSLLV